MANVWVGIDCGKHGGLSILKDDGSVESWHTPAEVTRTRKRKKSTSGKTRYSVSTEYDYRGMLVLLQKARQLQEAGHNVVVVIEQQRQRPADSKQTVFQIGFGMGLWIMACVANNLQFKTVLPSVWKSRYVPPQSTKKASLDMCKLLYPKHDLPLAKDEARAEATLIADYMRRQDLELDYPLTPLVIRKRRKRA